MSGKGNRLPKWHDFGVVLYTFFSLFVVFTHLYSKKKIIFLDFISVSSWKSSRKGFLGLSQIVVKWGSVNVHLKAFLFSERKIKN